MGEGERTQPGLRRRLYKCAGTRQAVRQTEQRRRCHEGEVRVAGHGAGESGRNQDDNRRVGAVMHDAQIRAIIPITVQIIVRGPVAGDAPPTPKHNRAPCSTRTADMGVRVDIGGWLG